MEFDSSKTPAYMDPVEFSYMDNGLDSYLQYPQSPAFNVGLGRTYSILDILCLNSLLCPQFLPPPLLWLSTP